MNELEYLTAKRSVDDRSLDRTVLTAFRDTVQARTEGNLRILEFGTGTGTMPLRLIEWDMLPDSVEYRAIERQTSHVERARKRIPEQLAGMGYTVEELDSADGRFHAIRGSQRIRFSIEKEDAFNVTGEPDVIIACAFLDLVSLRNVLSHISDLLTPGGLLYAPITFDGFTGFSPTHPYDDIVTDNYHRHMAQRAGGPQSGRQLLELVPEYGGDIVAVGGSDWIIRPVDGTYPAEEQAVIAFLVSTIHNAVSELPLTQEQKKNLDKWVERREQQIADESLTLIAHNLDILCQF